jgi:hypothetical protein
LTVGFAANCLDICPESHSFSALLPARLLKSNHRYT